MTADWSLPVCPEDLDWPGYATVAELEAAINRAPEEATCVDDPSTYSVDSDADPHGPAPLFLPGP